MKYISLTIIFLISLKATYAGPPRARSLKPCPGGFKAVIVAGKQDCICEDYHVYWPTTGLCYREFLRGPCNSGQQLVSNITGHAECRCPKTWARWQDGSCYPQYSQGPCPEGELFMSGDSGEGECSCSASQFRMNYFPKLRKCYQLYVQGPCSNGHTIKFDYATIQPRCYCKDGYMLEEDGACYPLNTAGPCNQTACGDGINCYLRNLDTLTTECKCLPGNVTTTDGHCFEPYTRGPCGLGQWLVFSEPGVAVCKTKGQCTRFDNWFFWKDDERCYRQYAKGPCPEGKLFYLDPNTGIAGCHCRKDWSPYYWPENDKCYEQHSIGPCSAGKYFSFNKTTLQTECNCFTSHVIHRETDKCYERMTRGPCPVGQLVVSHPESKELQCTCSKDMTSHYWPKTGHCYQHFFQGPCPKGQTFRIDHTTSLPSCVVWGK